MTQGNRGKAFEKEFWVSLNNFSKSVNGRLWDWCFNNVGGHQAPSRPADRIVGYSGTAWLLELKETQDPRFSFGEIRKVQHDNLDKMALTGNRALVVIKYNPKDVTVPSRVWAYDYRGIKLEQDISVAKSFHLLNDSKTIVANHHRIELFATKTKGLQLCWDLAPMFLRFGQ